MMVSSQLPRFIENHVPVQARCASRIVCFMDCVCACFYLCDFAPAIPGIPHRLKPLLLGRCPRRVGPTLLRLGLLDGGFYLGGLGRGGAPRRSTHGSGRARHLVLRKAHRFSLLGAPWGVGLREGRKGLLPLAWRDGRLEIGQLGRRGERGTLLRSRSDGRWFQIAFGGG